MSINILVYPVQGGSSAGTHRVVDHSQGDMLYRIGWGTSDTMYTLFNNICMAAPILRDHQVAAVNIYSNELAAHFLDQLQQQTQARWLRSIVTGCLKPGAVIFLVASSERFDLVMRNVANARATLAPATAAGAKVVLGDYRGRRLVLN